MNWKIIKKYLKQIRKNRQKERKKEGRKKDLEVHGTIRKDLTFMSLEL